MEYCKKYYASWINSKEVLMQSSSGGIFTALAEYVFEKNGYVYGVFRDSDTFELSHIEIKSAEELSAIRKSKYYQSNPSNAYNMVKKRLQEGTFVLFSGTACQIAGLKNVLSIYNIDMSKLITVDVLCHGVSNVKIYKKYLESQEKRYRKKIITTDFRTKNVSWNKGSAMLQYFANGEKNILRSNEDSYFIAFNGNLILRPSCYSCIYAGGDRKSDFTIADFWGVEDKDVNEEQLNQGIGLTVVNTEKAEVIWKALTDKDVVTAREISKEYGESKNLAFTRPQTAHPKRGYFFENIDKHDFEWLISRCFFKMWVKSKIKDYIGRERVNKIKRLIKK